MHFAVQTFNLGDGGRRRRSRVVHEHAPVVTPRDQPTSIDDAQRRYATSRRARVAADRAQIPRRRRRRVERPHRPVGDAAEHGDVIAILEHAQAQYIAREQPQRLARRRRRPRPVFAARPLRREVARAAPRRSPVSRRRHVPHVPRVRPERVALRAHLNRLSAVARVHDARREVLPARPDQRARRPVRVRRARARHRPKRSSRRRARAQPSQRARARVALIPAHRAQRPRRVADERDRVVAVPERRDAQHRARRRARRRPRADSGWRHGQPD